VTDGYQAATTFPRYRAFSGTSAPPPGPGDFTDSEGAIAPTRSRVLVVDDERLIADTVAQILNIHGYDAFSAYNGTDALKLAESFRPDYLLTDVMMPVMNGIDLALKLEKLLPGIKILLFSGQAGTNALLQRRQVDGQHFPIVAKPIHPERLVEALAALKTR
jgi:CheY-like chemotaxis protein